MSKTGKPSFIRGNAISLENCALRKMNNIKFLYAVLRCPNCNSTKLISTFNHDELICEGCKVNYPVSCERPVLLKPSNDVFNLDHYKNTKKNVGKAAAKNNFSRFIPTTSVNLSVDRILLVLNKMLAARTAAVVLVVGGGQQREWLDKRLGLSDAVNVIYTDIDVNADVDIFCDGHDLPFIDNVFDAVVTTAVLEHVLYPERVVAEIHRVLKVGGFIYSEIPFMQQVHEGAYDFTRYTLSGHRRLLNGFTEMESGMVAGPGTVMVWSIENFVLAFFSRPVLRLGAKVLVRLLFFWVKYFDYLLKNSPEAMDGSSCTFFFGSKSEQRVPDAEIISGYVGAKHLSHT